MSIDGGTVEQLDAPQMRLHETIQQVKRCCQPGATHEVLARASAILVQRLETYLAREEAVSGTMRKRVREALRFGDKDAGVDAMLSDLRALRSLWRYLPASSLALHINRLADELDARLKQERRDVFPVVRGDPLMSATH